MVAKNDITGDPITSKAATKAFREGWDRIFNKEKPIIVEKYNNGILISIPGSRSILRLTKKQYNHLILTILSQLTAEQIADAMKETDQ